MKFKICLFLIFLFSFYNNFTETKAVADSYSLCKMNNFICENYVFQENAVKVTYKSNMDKEDEIKLVKEKIKSKYGNENIKISNDEIDVGTSFKEVKVNFYSEYGKTIVDLMIINYNKEITISKLMKELTELQSKKAFEERYFQYIKGKINDIDDTLEEMKSLQMIRNIDTLDIHNGYVGKANFNDGERVNIALNKYDTGNYLIIGTPVIFTTY